MFTNAKTLRKSSQVTKSVTFFNMKVNFKLIATAAAIYSLEHGLCTFNAVLRSTQPSTLRGTVK